MSIEVQQEIARKVLAKLEILDPNAILAGGAPRDWFLGKEAKDLDFYIHLPNIQMEKQEGQFKALGMSGTFMGTTRITGMYATMVGLFRVYEMEYQGMPVQVMIMKEPTFNSVVSQFGCSTSKIWWKGKDVKPTPTFLLSMVNKVVFVSEGYAAKDSYVAKTMSYFPEFKAEGEITLPAQLKLCARMNNFYPDWGCFLRWYKEKGL